MRGLRSGDLVQIPLAEDVFALGQIIDFPRGDKRVILLILYPGTFASAEADARLPAILAQSPALEAITFDIQLKERRWAVVGNQPPPADYAPPLFRVLTPDGFAVIDHHHDFVRDRPVKNVKGLRNRTISDGRILERVARALAGLEPWVKEDDKFRIVGLAPSGADEP